MKLIQRNGKLVCAACGGRRLDIPPDDQHLIGLFGHGPVQEHVADCPDRDDEVQPGRAVERSRHDTPRTG